jgi:hypothetical protein
LSTRSLAMAVGKYPTVDSTGEASAGIRGGVTAALWTRPVEQGRASCGAVGGDDSGSEVNGGSCNNPGI